MCGAFNFVREELKQPHSSAVCMREAVMTAAAISGPLPIKIRNRDISSVSPSTRTYHTLASSKLFNEDTAVTRAEFGIVPVASDGYMWVWICLQ